MSLSLMAVLGCLTCGALAQTPAAPQYVIPSAEQAARDSDRVKILRQELKKSEALLETLARRKTERLAAADVEAADEAEEQRGRTLSDIAGLKRELAAATRSAASPFSTTVAAVTPKATAASPPSRPAKSLPPAPWWDVYSKARRTEVPPPVSSPISTPVFIAPAVAGPRTVSARRPE
ncbi:hypothetical protein LJR175_007788 [Variovorax sp. LjRoot175]|uniref:hypothetical protein n=1 Tax=Variovorax sp. LjRoot175 TaxID=3342276 RepID=UPI003ECFAA9F